MQLNEAQQILDSLSKLDGSTLGRMLDLYVRLAEIGLDQLTKVADVDPDPDDPWLSSRNAARRCQVSVDTFHRWMKRYSDQGIESMGAGNSFRIRRSECDRLLACRAKEAEA